MSQRQLPWLDQQKITGPAQPTKVLKGRDLGASNEMQCIQHNKQERVAEHFEVSFLLVFNLLH